MGKCRRPCAVLGRVRKEARPVERRLGEEIRQEVDVVVRLAGEPNDERRAHRRLWRGVPDTSNQVEMAVAITRTSHPTQQPSRGVLQAEVEVRGDHRVGSHLGDQRVAQLAWIQIQEAKHPKALDVRDETKKIDDPTWRVDVPAV